MNYKEYYVNNITSSYELIDMIRTRRGRCEQTSYIINNNNFDKNVPSPYAHQAKLVIVLHSRSHL